MNQEKIGKFIASCRKKQKLTQEQLAEKLGITYKAVSKWETGKGLPDASIMMDLCSILEINVNDLLSGEKVVIEQYIDKADENLIKLQKQKEIGISSARWTHITTIIIFLIWNAINVIKYGITQAIDMPEFIVMNIITLTYFIIYIFLLRRIERK
ncbi:MAG: helix-turn-helix transcriptional regulator [Firmicutes bacterium]|nr:helix-turn-helix transcriptional regulator [Bacillota bacterium]